MCKKTAAAGPESTEVASFRNLGGVTNDQNVESSSHNLHRKSEKKLLFISFSYIKMDGQHPQIFITSRNYITASINRGKKYTLMIDEKARCEMWCQVSPPEGVKFIRNFFYESF
jgi:hypothetical protein